jgi:3-mercaptopyruvate sulfurtransferase SseA
MREPTALITTDALARELGRAEMRIYDCTTYLEAAPPGSDDPYIVVSGRNSFEAGHVPGADFLDLQGEFSDQATRLRFMMPAVAQLEAAFGRHGLGDDTRVVLYSIGTMMWATRFWWMLKSLGFDGAAVLDGGFEKWQAEGLPVEHGPARGYPPATFVARPRPGWFVDKQAVLAAIPRADAVIVNALGAQFHQGLEPSRYGRPRASSTHKRRRSRRLRTRRQSLPQRVWPKTSTSLPIAVAASPPPSTCSCCTSSASTTSLFMMGRWANGRRMAPCRSREGEARRPRSPIAERNPL